MVRPDNAVQTEKEPAGEVSSRLGQAGLAYLEGRRLRTTLVPVIF